MTGLTTEEARRSRAEHGSNRLPELRGRSWLAFLADALGDRTLRVLLLCALLAFATGWAGGHAPTDGFGILLAVAVASGVSATNEWRAQAAFRSLQAADSGRVRIHRDGELRSRAAHAVVVGDVIELEPGARVPADGRVDDAVDFSVDESLLTGEVEPVAVGTGGEVRAGTTVTDGRARVVVNAVGAKTEYGRLRAELAFDRDPTPLQVRLAALADRIGLGGTAAAGLVFVALAGDSLAHGTITGSAVLRFLTLAVTIVVVAVPEGLPVAVTLSLAYGVRRLAREGTLVRRLVACETMGGASVLLVDKTGTLTLNRMEVVDRFAPGGPIDEERLARAVAVNGTAHLRDGGRGIGSPTEVALLLDLDRRGIDWRRLRGEARVVGVAAFSSDRKWMATRTDAEVLVKGAPEVLLSACGWIERDGARVPLDDADRDAVADRVAAWADQGRRTLLVAWRPADDGGWLDDLALVAVVAIADPVRPGAAEAVRRCRGAGVDVIVVTGDHLGTGVAVAREIGLMGPGDRAVEARALRSLDDEALARELSEVRVVGRALPADKLRLVDALRDQGRVVAVTGDGTNDGPALRHADVGLAMGRSGTDVAREASDLVLLDDDFSAVVRAIAWGRGIRANLERFVQFQLTVSAVALTTALVAGATGRGTPLGAAEMLWVNLIMDALAALALAVDRPGDEVLEDRPRGRTDALVTPEMIVQVAVLAIAMLAVLAVLLYGAWGLADPVRATLVFHAFVFLQVGNLFNARATRFDRSPVRGLDRSPAFIAVVGLIVAVQAAIVELGGPLFGTVPLGAREWAIAVAMVPYALACGAVLRAVGRRITLPRLSIRTLPEPVVAGIGVALMVGAAGLRAATPSAAGLAFAAFAAGAFLTGRYALQSRASTTVRAERLHLAGSIALAAVLVGQVNYVASRHFARFDWTANARFALSSQTRQVLAGLSHAVTITSVLRPGRIQAEIDGLLTEYGALGKAVEVRSVDPDASPGEVERLKSRANLPSTPNNAVVIDLDGRSRALSLEDLFERAWVYKGGKRYVDKEQPPLFRGEQAVTSALVALSHAEPATVCFARGHGERDPESFEGEGLSLFRDRLRRDGFEIRRVELVEGARVPDDCAVLASIGPSAPEGPADRASIAKYLERGGKWLLTLEPFQDPGLGPLLADWGAEVRPMYVVDPDASVAGADVTTLLAASYPPHPITAGLNGIPVVMPYAAAVRRTDSKRRLGGANLVLTGPHGIGETSADSAVPHFDAGVDRKGEISVATAIDEPPDLYSAEGRTEPARLVVVGDSDFVTNGQITRMGNADFATDAVDWLARREELIAVRGRPPEDRKISLSSDQQRAVWWLSLGGLPGGVALLGAAVAWRRRA